MPTKLKEWNIEKKLSVFAIIYFLLGLIFAFYYAWYYHWEILGYFSPGFYMVIFSWPYQAIGFVKDIMFYGFAGKTL